MAVLWSFMAKYWFEWTFIVFSRGHKSKFIWSCLSKFQSFASGVFLYITFMSLLPAEFSSRETERPQHQHNLKTTAVAGAGTSNKFEAISEDTKINGQKHLQMTWKVFAFTCGWALMSLLSLISIHWNKLLVQFSVKL